MMADRTTDVGELSATIRHCCRIGWMRILRRHLRGPHGFGLDVNALGSTLLLGLSSGSATVSHAATVSWVFGARRLVIPISFLKALLAKLSKLDIWFFQPKRPTRFTSPAEGLSALSVVPTITAFG